MLNDSICMLSDSVCMLNDWICMLSVLDLKVEMLCSCGTFSQDYMLNACKTLLLSILPYGNMVKCGVKTEAAK